MPRIIRPACRAIAIVRPGLFDPSALPTSSASPAVLVPLLIAVVVGGCVSAEDSELRLSFGAYTAGPGTDDSPETGTDGGTQGGSSDADEGDSHDDPDGSDTEPSASEDTAGTEGFDDGGDSGDDASDTEPGTGDGEPGEPVEVELSNVPLPCANPNGVAPLLPGEADYLAATVLTPDAYPFEVTHVEYELIAGGACNSTFPHVVHAFAVGAQVPASPSLGPFFASAVVEYDPSATNGRHVALPLETPLVLQPGESVAIAVRLAVNASITESICLATCMDSTTPGLDFWSNGVAEPYLWQDLVSEFGLANATVRAIGHVQ